MNLNDRQSSFRIGRVFLLLLAIAIGLILADNAGLLGTPLSLIRNPLTALSARTNVFRSTRAQPVDMELAVQEIDGLRAQVELLENENRQLRSIEAEYQRLLALLDKANQTPQYARVTASVIGRGPNPLFRDLIIDRGSNDGILVGMPVEGARGLVGQVFRTTPDSAQIRLVIDTNSRIPGRLFTGRATGVIAGEGATGLMTMDWIDPNAQIELNDDVLTSGLDGSTFVEQVANRFPPDILIGKVIEKKRAEAALFQQVVIQPAVDFDNLEVVFVITNFEPIDTSLFNDTDEESP